MRSIWSGAISFGLIYIPVRLYNASETTGLDFDLLRKGDLCPIRYAKVCRHTGEEVAYEDIVKGYQYKKGDYVIVSPEDFRRANVKKTQTIEIVAFVKEEELDDKLLEKPYFLEPVKGAGRAYALLREALRRTDKVGIARFVLRTREHMAVLKAEGDVIVLDQMRFESELRQPTELSLPSASDVQARELEMAEKLIDQLTEPFNPSQYHDTYTEQLLQLIEEKAQGKEPVPEEEQPVPAEVTDLFARLRESLDQAQSRRAA